MRTATFEAMSGNYLISSIKVTGAEGGGSDSAQKINSNGSWGDMYYYLTMDGTGYVEDGWYKDAFGDEPVTEADALELGEALIISASADCTMTFAGQVVSGDAIVNVPAGSSIVGNPTPSEAKIGDIIVVGAEGGGSDSAQKILANGSWGAMYYYLTMDATGYVEDGWYMDAFGDEPVTNEDVLAPGESMIFSAVNDMILKFPAVL